jgi:hypothetical protein
MNNIYYYAKAGTVSFYFSILYGLSFLFLFFVIAGAVRRASGSQFHDAFYMLAAFSLARGASVFLGLQSVASGEQGLWFSSTILSLSNMCSVIANVFLFQSALSFLLFRHASGAKFRGVPVIIFAMYIILYVSGAIDASEIDNIGRLSFGYNSAILSGIAMFNIYSVFKDKSPLIILSGVGFIMYAVFEGMILKPPFGMDIFYYRLISGIVLLASSFSMTALAKTKKTYDKIGYV